MRPPTQTRAPAPSADVVVATSVASVVIMRGQ